MSKHVFGALARTTLRSPAGRRLAVSLLSTVAIGFLASLPAAAPSPVQPGTTPAASASWLTRLNQWRTSTGLATLTENTLWSQGDAAHAFYMVKTGLVTHYEDPANPYYTVAGDTAAQNSNIQVSSSTGTTDDQAIDWWMAAPFHAMNMMDPRLTQTGFGSYRDGTASPWQEGGALDTIRGNSFSGGSYPVYFPGNGTTEPLTRYGGGEFPDPLQACPGYSAPTGLPVFIQIGGNVNTTAGATHSFTGNGTALSHCVIDSSNSAVSSYLYTRGGVILVPQQPLQSGVKYVVALTVNGVAYTWSFTVGPFFASVSAVTPNAGALAGGTTVTITGAGFNNSMASVKFGTTSATSFSVVNDTTVTAVSPAHTAGTVDVTVTTASGTSATSALDHFTFGACTAVTVSAAPPSPSTPGTAVKFTGSAFGCSNPLYEFWILAPGGSWTIMQAYSTSATFNWNTTGLAGGSYLYSVWVRDAASSAGYDAFFPGTAYALTSSTCASVSASAAPPSPSISGTAVTITGAALGCANARYEFWILPPGGSWSIGQAYSSSATFSWNTTGLVAGTYSYSVWIRDASSTASYDAYFPGTGYTLTSTNCTSVSASAAPPSPSMLGTAVTFTGAASGCPNPRYEFWILPPGGSWTIAQAYSSSATFSWNTTGLTAGAYSYSVWVRDAASSAGYDAFFPGTAYTLTSPCASVTASTMPVSPQSAGTAITVTASASGCTNPRYEFWILAPAGSWKIAQAYSSSATFTWNTTPPSGTYSYSVWVRDASSAAAYDAFLPGTTYTLTTTPCTSVTATAAPASPQAHGTTISITASASGCSNPRYEFWILAPGSSTWTIVQSSSSSATFSWNTSGLPAGTYRYSVWVHDASSAAGYDAYFPGTTYTLT